MRPSTGHSTHDGQGPQAHSVLRIYYRIPEYAHLRDFMTLTDNETQPGAFALRDEHLTR